MARRSICMLCLILAGLISWLYCRTYLFKGSFYFELLLTLFIVLLFYLSESWLFLFFLLGFIPW